MKIKLPRKILASKLLKLKMACMTDHANLMYPHMDAAYMRQRAKEEIISNGDLAMAQRLLIMADVKDEHESKNSKK
jgi:hypothetical protein